jgi:hypothetical protein
VSLKMVVIMKGPTTFRVFSAEKLFSWPPGPVAQAFTFRAFGAETRHFHTLSKVLGYEQSCRLARLTNTP